MVGTQREDIASLFGSEDPHLLIVFGQKLDLPDRILRNCILKAIEKNLQASQFTIDRRRPQVPASEIVFMPVRA